MTFRFQVNRAKRCADLRKRMSLTSGTVLGGRCNIYASRTRCTPSSRQDSDPPRTIATVVGDHNRHPVKGLTPEDVDERLAVDPKTVERWITLGRIPYPRHRHTIAAMAGESETYLWPGPLPSQRRGEVAQSEIVHVCRPQPGLSACASTLRPSRGIDTCRGEVSYYGSPPEGRDAQRNFESDLDRRER